ncbi:MAG: alanine--tRNA ligase, partial [Chlamydiota bacterium]
AIADGAQPSNTDLGYILRKILRRAVRYGRLLQFKKPFLSLILPRLIETMGEDYPELKTSKGRIEEILHIEEESFLKTLQRGGNLLNQVIDNSKEKILGEDAFKLKDTYGFPVEEILLIAKDYGLTVDLPRFNELEEEAKEKSRKAQKVYTQVFDLNFFNDFTKTHKPSKFIGYTSLEIETPIIAIVKDGDFVDSLQEGEMGGIILGETPFYSEMGGQVGDKGTLSKGSTLFEVDTTSTPYEGVILHEGILRKGSLKKQERVLASVNKERRGCISNNHTATHILHWALEKVLGNQIRQAGSVVDEHRLRFDFSHHKALSSDELTLIEDLVNEKIRSNQIVSPLEISLEEAQGRKDIKQFFGEKYGKTVRVIDIDFSKELCGGTHTKALGQIGLFKIIKESSIAAGVRRIDAVCGKEAENHVKETEKLLFTLSSLLKTTPLKLLEKTEGLIQENKEFQTEIKKLKKGQEKEIIASLKMNKHKGKTFSYIVEETSLPIEDLSSVGDQLLSEIEPGVVILGAKTKEKCQMVIKASPKVVENGFSAQDLIQQLSPLFQGKGGGKKENAQAGGPLLSGLEEALKKAKVVLDTLC